MNPSFPNQNYRKSEIVFKAPFPKCIVCLVAVKYQTVLNHLFDFFLNTRSKRSKDILTPSESPENISSSFFVYFTGSSIRCFCRNTDQLWYFPGIIDVPLMTSYFLKFSLQLSLIVMTSWCIKGLSTSQRNWSQWNVGWFAARDGWHRPYVSPSNTWCLYALKDASLQ